MLKKAIVIGVPIVGLLALVGWRYSQKQASTAKLAQVGAQRKNGAVNVEIAQAGPKDLIQSVQLVGSIESPFNVSLSPKLTGRLVFLDVREGATIKQGEVVARIDPTETEGQVLQAKSALAQARANLASAEINQTPANANVTSQLKQGEATLRSNKADFDQVVGNYESNVQTAHSSVVDATAKVASAKSNVGNAEANVQSAKASLENATSKFNREEGLYKQGFVAAQDVDDARTAVKVAQSAVSVAEGQLRSAQSAQESAQAVLKATQDSEAIAIRKGKTDIRSASAKVDVAKASLTYAVANQAQTPAYRAQLAALQSAVDAAVGNLNQAEARLSDLNLVSPIDGTVTKRSADPGAVVTAGTSVLNIQYLKWVYVTSAVPVEYTGKVIVGSPVSIQFDSLPNKDFTGRVAEVNQAADPQSRQFLIRIKLDNTDGALRPGMFAQVSVTLSKTRSEVVVPREAVKTSNEGKSTVTVIDSENKAHIVGVELGGQDTTGIAIVRGLDPGQKVVKLSYTPVRDGQKVTFGDKGSNGKRSSSQDAPSIKAVGQ